MAKIACPMLVLLTVVLLTVVAQPVQAQQQTPEALAARVAGCYTLDIGPWPEALDRDYHPDPAGLAMKMRLDTMRFTARWMEPEGTSTEELRKVNELFSLDRAFLAYDSFERKWQNWAEWEDWKSRQIGEANSFSPERLWWAEGPDSLSIRGLIMLAGFSWHLKRENNLLRGSVTSFTDHVKEDQPSSVTAPVVARPVLCSPER